jgi:omega-amidase
VNFIKKWRCSLLKLRIACLQINIAFGETHKNIARVEKEIEHIVTHELVDVIVLPELWTTGYDLKRLLEIGDEEGVQVKQLLATWSKKYAVHIVGGSIAKKTEKGIYNTMYVVDHAGEMIHEYSKLHLFRLMEEEKYLKPGNGTSLFQLEGETCAGMICYDIRFPEWIRVHTLKGAKIVFVVAEWPKPRLDHWRTLLLARAIENQCYVVACNRVGSDPANEFGGHSLIIDPWGKILAEGKEDEENIIAEVDLDLVDEVRKKIPVFEDRLPFFYKDFERH